jgi:hypothetical protein
MRSHHPTFYTRFAPSNMPAYQSLAPLANVPLTQFSFPKSPARHVVSEAGSQKEGVQKEDKDLKYFT